MNISKPISTASRLRATFTSSAAPERAGKPIHATLDWLQCIRQSDEGRMT